MTLIGAIIILWPTRHMLQIKKLQQIKKTLLEIKKHCLCDYSDKFTKMFSVRAVGNALHSQIFVIM